MNRLSNSRPGASGVASGVAALVAAASLSIVGCSNKLSGEIRVSTEQHGEWTVKPSECFSGQRSYFHGVDLAGGGNKARAINDPRHGYSLVLHIPGGEQTLVVEQAQCQDFDIYVERQSSTINDITNVEGHVRASCKTDAVSITADVTFENCH